ncbi:hypothetical protein B0H17DRAFT_1225877 [Mycena rosella]|uniref:Uncharacterized protein n=1 Tax=Mycena rosella TaxID=1033263 RepID=A0AAD7D8X0_MYCRO|nr:hypothetical protein B0H17DRAFT_1225877 [Mycena rosella]
MLALRLLGLEVLVPRVWLRRVQDALGTSRYFSGIHLRKTLRNELRSRTIGTKNKPGFTRGMLGKSLRCGISRSRSSDSIEERSLSSSNSDIVVAASRTAKPDDSDVVVTLSGSMLGTVASAASSHTMNNRGEARTSSPWKCTAWIASVSYGWMTASGIVHMENAKVSTVFAAGVAVEPHFPFHQDGHWPSLPPPGQKQSVMLWPFLPGAPHCVFAHTRFLRAARRASKLVLATRAWGAGVGAEGVQNGNNIVPLLSQQRNKDEITKASNVFAHWRSSDE